jgi:MFS transporter, DHA1 family, inner membrane transport protein
MADFIAVHRFMSMFMVLAACGFASSFSLRLIDPLVLPVASHFAVASSTAAMLSPAYALPYALSQPFLGPISDRFGRIRCMRVCMAGLALTLFIGAIAPNFETLFASRMIAGVFGGGLVPLVLAALGDAYAMGARQVAIGRMLFALISGQMLGSIVAGFASEAAGWRSAFWISFVLAVLAAILLWIAARRADDAHGGAPGSFRALYARVFANPKAKWLYPAVFVEGTLFFGFFPFAGEALLAIEPGSTRDIARHVGMVLGAFGIGGLAYALTVRRLLRVLGVTRMCIVASMLGAAGYGAVALSGTWWQAALAMFGSGLAFYMLHNSLQTEATELAPAARGSAVALFASGLFLGQGAGPLLFGPLSHLAGHSAAYAIVAIALLVLGQVVVRRIVGRPAQAH